VESLLSILGSIASIGGAVWAYYQAVQSKKYATEARHLRDDIVNRRKLVEVSQVYSETKRILNVVSRIGPTCTADSIKGIDCAGIAKEVEEYSRFLNEQSSHFDEFFNNRARELCDQLASDIEALSEATQFENIKKNGKNIYYKIYEFLPFVKSLTDEKKEQESPFQEKRRTL